MPCKLCATDLSGKDRTEISIEGVQVIVLHFDLCMDCLRRGLLFGDRKSGAAITDEKENVIYS